MAFDVKETLAKFATVDQIAEDEAVIKAHRDDMAELDQKYAPADGVYGRFPLQVVIAFAKERYEVDLKHGMFLRQLDGFFNVCEKTGYNTAKAQGSLLSCESIYEGRDEPRTQDETDYWNGFYRFMMESA